MLVILDWDGTLINSANKIVYCMQSAARDLKLQVREEQAIKNIIGLGLPEAIQLLYPGEAKEIREKFRELYSKHFVDADQIPCPFFPGVVETLQDLHKDGHLLTVATGKSRRGLNRILNNVKLENFFHGSRCADETQSKPNPQMIHELLDEFSVEPENALMVGDTSYDLEMAKNANIKRVGVSYGAHNQETLNKFEPLEIINEFKQLKDIVEQIENDS